MEALYGDQFEGFFEGFFEVALKTAPEKEGTRKTNTGRAGRCAGGRYDCTAFA